MACCTRIGGGAVKLVLSKGRSLVENCPLHFLRGRIIVNCAFFIRGMSTLCVFWGNRASRSTIGPPCFLSKLLEKGLSQLAHFLAQLDGRDDFHGSQA